MRTDDPYKRIAPLYDRLIEPLQAGIREVALKTVTPRPSWTVLDVGCGTGTALAQYLDAGCAVAGVDVSPAMIAQATARLGERAELFVTDGGPLPFADGAFDLVTASMVLHEVTEEDRVGLVAEMARVTKATGRMMFVDYRFGPLRGLKGRGLRTLSVVVERFSGHYAQFRSFEAAGGLPRLIDPQELRIEREKIVGGGNMAIWLVSRRGQTPNGRHAGVLPPGRGDS